MALATLIDSPMSHNAILNIKRQHSVEHKVRNYQTLHNVLRLPEGSSGPNYTGIPDREVQERKQQQSIQIKYQGNQNHRLPPYLRLTTIRHLTDTYLIRQLQSL